MEITASMVKELREASGAGMMDCKTALTECKGNMDEAMNYLREKVLRKNLVLLLKDLLISLSMEIKQLF